MRRATTSFITTGAGSAPSSQDSQSSTARPQRVAARQRSWRNHAGSPGSAGAFRNSGWSPCGPLRSEHRARAAHAVRAGGTHAPLSHAAVLMMMPIILAIESDRRRRPRGPRAPGHRRRIIVVGSIAAALDILKTRRPDLVLTPPLFSTRDDSTLTARLREFGDDGVELPDLSLRCWPRARRDAATGDRTGGC